MTEQEQFRTRREPPRDAYRTIERWQFDVESRAPAAGIAVADGAAFACAGGLKDDSGPRVCALDPA